MDLPVSTILLVTGLCLMLIGIYGILAHRNIMRMIIGFALVDTGIHIVMVATGYITGGTAPIIDAALPKAEAAQRAVDPIPSALTVTAIVIGFSVTAVMLAYAIRLYEAKKTLSIEAFSEPEC
jgi:multicomponent Na+:H+ antiporter subunit C